jgi:putative inorganic carbon (hco3(-)) transporter
MLLIIAILIFIRPFICALAFPYLNFGLSFALLVILGVYLIYKKPLFTKARGLIYPLVLFCLALFLSLFFSRDRFNSLAQLYQYLSGLGLLWVASSLSDNHKRIAIQTIVLAGLVISLLAIYQYLFGFKHVLNYMSANQLSWPFFLDYLARKRVFFPFVTPGALGGYLAMVMFLSLNSKHRIWFSLLIFTALVLTKSVNAFFCLWVVIVIYFALQNKLKKAQLLLLGGLLISVLVMIVARSATEKNYLHPAFSVMMRLNYWQGAWEIIKAHPLVGIGLGNFNLANSRYAHNSYLQIWAEMGILGLFSFIWIVEVIFKSGFRSLTKLSGERQTVCLLTASAFFLMHNFLDFTFFLPEISLVWWVILGLTVAGE